MNAEWTRIYVPQLPTAGASRNECRERAAKSRRSRKHNGTGRRASNRRTGIRPQERIRLWESLHGAQLPRDADPPCSP